MPPSDPPLTGYAQALKKQDKYPVTPRPPWRMQDPRSPVATPYLVIPNSPQDEGALRPLDARHAKQSPAIEFMDVKTNSAATPVAGGVYALRCEAHNRGGVGCYAGIAEFYVATPAALDALAAGAGPRPAPLGFAGFSIRPGGHTVVTCQRHWTADSLDRGILVRIYDPIMDRPKFPYDSAADRHIARRDVIPDFNGTYSGTEHSSQSPGAGVPIKIVIEQVNNSAKISIYEEAPPPAPVILGGSGHAQGSVPSVPARSSPAAVTGATFVFNYTEPLVDGHPFAENVWTFSLKNPDLLHFTRHCHFLSPFDRVAPDRDFTGDLIRQRERKPPHR